MGFEPQVVLNYREAARIAARAGVTATPGDPVAEARQQTQKSGSGGKNLASASAAYRPQIRPRPALLSVRPYLSIARGSSPNSVSFGLSFWTL
jgi:hypothetical protein